MSVSAVAVPPGRALTIRGRRYPVLLPSVRDARLHLASVIISLQVLGQVAFDFRVSIAQILISLGTCALLEVGIAFWRQRVIMWPASALITGNGVGFILRVPGTHHGDWWSLHGWWIYLGTAAVSLLSKHLVRVRGGHIFNPSNIGLVLCFLVLGSGRAEPLDFWWGPMSPWMVAALVIIVSGGLAILSRLHLLVIAVGFWVSFAAGVGVLAASGHAMAARWHLGPVTGLYFWWVLVTSPEILVFLFFMITDPKTTPSGFRARIAYAAGIGLLTALLIAPARTEFWSKVAVLGALAIVCASRPVLERFPIQLARPGGRRLAAAASVAAAGFAGLLVVAGIPARSSAGAAVTADTTSRLPRIAILPSKGVESKLDRRSARGIARALVADLRQRAQSRISSAGGRSVTVPTYRVDRMSVWLEPGTGQGAATAVARLGGVKWLTLYGGFPRTAVGRAAVGPFRATVRLKLDGSRYVIVSGIGAGPTLAAAAPAETAAVKRAAVNGFKGLRLTDVAGLVGLDFRQGAFRFGMSPDPSAMLGGGVCWLDYNNDGWLDLFVVNSYAQADYPYWETHGGLPRSALFENVKGRFVNVSAKAHANLAVRGNGCVAGDLNGDGYPDLFVTTNEQDKLLWNNGDGTFTEGALAAGIDSHGWHSGAAIADVNGDGRPDLFVAGYMDPYSPMPGSAAGFPNNYAGVRDLLFLNEGNDKHGHARFREVGPQVGLDPSPYDHSLGAVFIDVNGDGRPDLYVVNDGDPNRLYLNERGGPLGFHFADVGRKLGVADRNAGMGVAAGDYSGDGRPDLFVTNSRGETHAVFRSQGTSFVDGRPAFLAPFGNNFTGWGVSWVDLNNDGYLDLVLANGSLPVTNLIKDARRIQVLENLTGQGLPGQFADAGPIVGMNRVPRVDGRGVAAADYNNDGRVDVAVNTIGGPLVLLRNTGATGHWLEVALKEFSPGAVVTAVLPDGRRLVHEVLAGSSYLSSEDPRVHFGLGTASEVRELLVDFPGGSETRLENLPADHIVTIAQSFKSTRRVRAGR